MEKEKHSPSDAEELWHLKDTVGCLQDLVARARLGKTPALRFEMQALAIGRDW